MMKSVLCLHQLRHTRTTKQITNCLLALEEGVVLMHLLHVRAYPFLLFDK